MSLGRGILDRVRRFGGYHPPPLMNLRQTLGRETTVLRLDTRPGWAVLVYFLPSWVAASSSSLEFSSGYYASILLNIEYDMTEVRDHVQVFR